MFRVTFYRVGWFLSEWYIVEDRLYMYVWGKIRQTVFQFVISGSHYFSGIAF